MRKKRTLTSKSSKQPGTPSLFMKKATQQSKTGSQWTAYQNISELPLYLFIDASVDDKISGLVKTGFPTEMEIQGIWQEIMIQFNEAMGDNESRRIFSLHKQIKSKDVTRDLINKALFMLRHPDRLTPKGIAKFEKFLNDTLYSNIVLDLEDKDEYEDQLQVFKNMAASITLAIDMHMIEYKALKDKKKSVGQKPDRIYYQTVLLNLSDHAGYEVTDKISTFEFCERFRRLNNFIDRNKK